MRRKPTTTPSSPKPAPPEVQNPVAAAEATTLSSPVRKPLRAPSITPGRAPLLDVAEVAAYAHISEKLVRAEVARGNLLARRLGRLLRFRAADVEAWLDAARVGGRS